MTISWVDPARSRALLVGVPSYTDPKLRSYPVITQNITDLKAVLTDPAIGGLDPAHVVAAPPGASIPEIGGLLAKLAAEATDLLLFYYCGHGLVGGKRDGQYYLSVRDTVQHQEAYTALAYDAVRREFLGSRAARRVVILDACFSGRALGGHLGADDTEFQGQVAIEGSYILPAAAQDAAALVLDGEPHTAFTGRLLDLLRNGDPRSGEALTIGDISDQMRTRLHAAGLGKLEDGAFNGLQRLPLVRNRAYVRPAPGLLTGIPSTVRPSTSDPAAIAEAGRAAGLNLVRTLRITGWSGFEEVPVALTPDGARSAFGLNNKVADVATGAVVAHDDRKRRSATREFFLGPGVTSGPDSALCWSPDGWSLASARRDKASAASSWNTVRIWPLGGTAREFKINEGTRPRGLAWSPSGQRIALVHNGEVGVYDVATGSCSGRITGLATGLRGHPVTWVPGTREHLLLLLLPDGSITVWSPDEGIDISTRQWVANPHPMPDCGLAASPGGGQYAYCRDGVIHVLTPAPLKSGGQHTVRALNPPSGGGVPQDVRWVGEQYLLGFLFNGPEPTSRLATFGLWDAATGVHLLYWTAPLPSLGQNQERGYSVSADGKRIAIIHDGIALDFFDITGI